MYISGTQLVHKEKNNLIAPAPLFVELIRMLRMGFVLTDMHSLKMKMANVLINKT